MIQLQVFKEVTVRTPKTKIVSLFEMIYKKELSKKAVGVVNLIFTNDVQLKKLNNDFRNKNKATDVLSFNIDEPTEDEAVFGEIYISIMTATAQAKEYNAPLSEELLRLCCHGFLHLLGYDHIDSKDAIVMKAKEEKYLAKVYA